MLVDPASASLKDLYLLDQLFHTNMEGVELKDTRTKITYPASAFLDFLRHHIPTRNELDRDADGFLCLDGWKISHFLMTAKDIHALTGISISKLHNHKVFCNYRTEMVDVNIDMHDQVCSVDSYDLYRNIKLAFTKKYNDKIVMKYSKDNNYKIGMDILYKGLYRLINNVISFNK